VEEQMQEPEPNNKAVDVNNISVTVVYDNNLYKEGLETSWGFSCVITGTKETVLFDMGGDGRLLLENISKIVIGVNSIETVFLSHIHGDHTGGLGMFLKKNPKVNVYLPKSFPKRFKEKVISFGAGIIEVDEQTEICKNVYSTGQMGVLIKEQGLILQIPKGLVIITGCAHPGIVKMVKTAKDLFDEPVLLVMGGFHLEWATKDKIKSIIMVFEDMNVKYVAPCHCTSKKAISLFAEHFGDCYINSGVGKAVKIGDLN
jgi:7,8-dihydropterin-6-yl-methyl-4-(beta-D-ribofuranosyl)aminobenzene 5'-phosphate synthase